MKKVKQPRKVVKKRRSRSKKMDIESPRVVKRKAMKGVSTIVEEFKVGEVQVRRTNRRSHKQTVNTVPKAVPMTTR